MLIRVFLFIALYCISSFSQSSGQLKNDLNNLFNTSRQYFFSVNKFNQKDFQAAGIVGASVAISSLIDDDVKRFVHYNFDSTNIFLSKIDSYYHIEFMSSTILGTYIYGSLSDNHNMRKLSTNLLTSSLLTTLTTFGIKSFFGRSRPYVTDEKYEFNWFELDDKFLSFPSGHTSLAFSFSTIMAEEKNNFFWKSFWFSAATLVGASRIYNNKHWFSDVIMGAVIGYATAKFVLKYNKNNFSDTVNLPSNNIVILIRL